MGMEAVNDRAAALRQAYPRALSRTLAFTRSLPDAEDAMQEAVVRALSSWSQSGVPDSPEAWLVTVAKNVHRDRLRKGKWEAPQEDALATLAQMSPWVQMAVGELAVARGWKDELLRLLFACCHPALEPGESAALCLSTIVGLSIEEVAGAFVVAPRTMEQRLTRARRRLRERGDSEGATPERSRDRLDAVLHVLHLLFNEGYWSNDDEPIRAELCRLALGLAHSLLETFSDEPEVAGLLALLLFHDSRRAARLHGDGTPVPLPEQDRSRWDHSAIERATRLLEAAASQLQPGPFQIEAAISATHCRARTSAETDWQTIAALYASLETLRPTPAVRVNRAFAVSRAEGARAGLSLLELDSGVESYPYVHLVKATLLAELGDRAKARVHFLEAHRHARNAAERAQIEARIVALSR
jgi:RNA polymerase sigma-70 factor (ECF subfamily)